MRILAFLTDAFDPEHTLELDQTPAFDPAEPEPEPDLEFDLRAQMDERARR